MPRYFFNVYDGTDMVDEEGTDLKDFKEMRFYMLTMATQILMDEKSHKDVWQMEVLDARGVIVASMDFGIDDRQHRRRGGAIDGD